MIAVAGGGGGGYKATTVVQQQYVYYTYGGSGGMGGSHIRCFLTPSSTSSSYTVTVGSGGSASSGAASGSSGGSTSLKLSTTTIVECTGGNGGVYNGSNSTPSSYYSVSSSSLSNIQSRQGGQGGTAGSYSKSAGSGSSSDSYTTNFSIPSDIVGSVIQYYYGGGGGGGATTYGGKAGSGSGGSASGNSSSSGQAASLYGAGGGGACGSASNSGGSGKQGLVAFYFPIESLSPIPLSYMTIWLDATDSSLWLAGQWRNKAYQSCSDATTFMGTWTSSSRVSSAINGNAAIQFNGTNALSTSDPAGTYTSGITLFVVFQPTATNTYTGLVTRTSSKVAAPIEFYNSTRRLGNGTTYTPYTTSATSLNSLINTSNIFTFRVDTTTSSSYVYASEWLNGKAVYSNTSVASSYCSDTATAVYIGCKGDGTSSTTTSSVRYTGYIGEVIMYKKALSDTEVSKVNTYLAGKWSITT